jgi:hypothetical protein
MKRLSEGLVWVAAFTFALDLFAQSNQAVHSNHYNAIMERNTFGLKILPALTGAETLRPPELPRLALTGIAQMGSNTMIFVTMYQGQTPVYYALHPGHCEGDLEVLGVNRTAATVLIRQSGVDKTLSFSPPVPPVVAPEENLERQFPSGKLRADGV